MLVKQKAEKSHHKITMKIKKLKEDLKSLANRPSINNDEGTRVNEVVIASKLAHLEKIVAHDQKDHMKAMLANHSEQLGGPWSAISKENKPKDLILQLKVPNSNPPRMERCTKCMATLAQNYHENLLHKGLGTPGNHPGYGPKIDNILKEIPTTQCLSKEQSQSFEWKIEPEHVREALLLVKNGSATSMDGLPYELWKELKNTNEKVKEKEDEGFEIADTLALVFKDIQEYRIDKRSDFAIGWMCPIYKKKDKNDISNYWPITLLNMVYILLTKVLVIQLMNISQCWYTQTKQDSSPTTQYSTIYVMVTTTVCLT